jgi:hypothetical protein
MNEERKMILQMLKDGEISIDEAERLLDAVPDDGLAPKRISIKVSEGEKVKINLKIPFSLMRTAIKLGKTAGFIGAMSTKSMQGDMSDEIMDTIKAIDPDEIISGLTEGVISLPHTIVDVDDEMGQNVVIVLE